MAVWNGETIAAPKIFLGPPRIKYEPDSRTKITCSSRLFNNTEDADRRDDATDLEILGQMLKFAEKTRFTNRGEATAKCPRINNDEIQLD